MFLLWRAHVRVLEGSEKLYKNAEFSSCCAKKAEEKIITTAANDEAMLPIGAHAIIKT